MGFKDVKSRILECLNNGTYDHELRGSIDTKNLFQCGVVGVDELCGLIHKTRGNQYSCSPHHQIKEIDVHVMKPVKNGTSWYLKFYFLEPDAMFISVHKSGD